MSTDIFGLQRAVWESDFDPLDRLVLLAILSYWSPESPEPFPSWPALIQRTGLSRATLARRLQSLTQVGAIRITTKAPRARSQPTNHYDLSGLVARTNPSQRETGLSVRPVTQKDPSQRETGLSVRQRGSQSETETRLSVRPEVSIEQSIEVSNRSPSPQKGSRKKISSGETDARVAPVIATYADAFEAEFLRKPATNYPRAAKAVTLLPAHVTGDDLKRAILIQLTQRRHDQYAKKREAIELHEIVGMVDQILAWAPRRGPTSPGRLPRIGEHGWRRQPDAGGIDFDQYALKPEGTNG